MCILGKLSSVDGRFSYPDCSSPLAIFRINEFSFEIKTLKIAFIYIAGRMGINFHHPGTDNIMALNSK